jgi:hypothetical protein
MTISFWDKGGEEAAIPWQIEYQNCIVESPLLPLPPHKMAGHSERNRRK